MNRVIKSYSKLHSSLRDEIYMGYSEGEFERTSFPYNGKVEDGIICQYDDVVYLIPISTIIAGRAGSSDDLDNEDDEQPSEIDTDLDSDEE